MCEYVFVCVLLRLGALSCGACAKKKVILDEHVCCRTIPSKIRTLCNVRIGLKYSHIYSTYGITQAYRVTHSYISYLRKIACCCQLAQSLELLQSFHLVFCEFECWYYTHHYNHTCTTVYTAFIICIQFVSFCFGKILNNGKNKRGVKFSSHKKTKQTRVFHALVCFRKYLKFWVRYASGHSMSSELSNAIQYQCANNIKTKMIKKLRDKYGLQLMTHWEKVSRRQMKCTMHIQLSLVQSILPEKCEQTLHTLIDKVLFVLF